MKKNGTITEIISTGILFLFVYTAISKLADHERFRDALHSSALLRNYAGLIAWAIPISELIAALLLMIPSTRLKGLYVSLGLLILFTLYILWMIFFADHLPCNCGGFISKLSWKQHVWFNLFFIGVSIAGIYSFKQQALIQKDIQH